MNRNLTVVIDGNIAGFDRAINQAVSGLSNFASKAQQIGTALSLSVSAPLGVLAKKSVDAYRELDSLTRGLATVEKDASSLASRLSLLQDVAKLPGLSFTGAIEGDLRLRTVFNTMLDGEKAARLSERTIRAFGNALASVGKGGTDFREVSNQLTQLLGSGKLQGDELRVISERVPQARNAILAAFGTLDTKLINSRYNAVQVVEGIITQLEKLPKASGGVNNAFENFSDSSFRAFAKLGQIIDQSAGLTGLLDSMSNTITKLVDKFGQLSPTTQTVLIGIAGLAVAVPPLLAVLGTLSSVVIPAIVAGFSLIATPIGALVGVIGVAVAAIVTQWDKVKQALLESNVWDTLRSLAENGLGLITSVFGVFANLIQGDWANVWEHLVNVGKFAFNTLIDVAATAVLTIGKHLRTLFSAIGMDSWAKGLESKMNDLFLKFQSKQFVINSPKVNTKLFDGFNFGGKNKPTVQPPVGGGEEKGTGYELKSTLELLQQGLHDAEEKIKDFTVRGLKVPDEVLNSYYGFTDTLKHATEALEDLKKTDDIKVKPIDSRNVLGSVKEQIDEANRHLKFNTALNGGGEFKAPKLPNLESFQKNITTALKPVKKAFVDLNEDISEGLRRAAESALVGMGEVIGGLLAGTAGIEALPQMLLSVLGSLLEQLGQMAIQVGLGVAAIQTALKTLNPFVAIAAGIGLIALGAMVKASSAKMAKPKGYEDGGLFTGESIVRLGESSKARMGGGEFAAPVEKGANLIGDRIMDNLVSALPSMRSLPSGYSPEKKMQLEINGELTAHGQSLRLALSRANVSSKVFGNG